MPSKKKSTKPTAKKKVSKTKKTLPNFKTKLRKDQHFYLNDGKMVKNLFELTDALEKMANEIFAHHVTDVRNDFADWIHDVFQEEDLAEDLRREKDQKDHHYVVLKFIVKNLK